MWFEKLSKVLFSEKKNFFFGRNFCSFFLYKKSAFFSMKTPKKISKFFFFFKVVGLFIYFIFFHETEVWCQVLLKVLFFEKKITKFQTWFFFFFTFFWFFPKYLLFFIFQQISKKIFSRWLFDFVERDLWYLWWHWDYLSCSPGLGEHFQKKKVGRLHFRPF